MVHWNCLVDAFGKLKNEFWVQIAEVNSVIESKFKTKRVKGSVSNDLSPFKQTAVKLHMETRTQQCGRLLTAGVVDLIVNSTEISNN